MTYTGKVKNGVVILPPEASLPEGAEVQVTPRSDDPFTDCTSFVIMEANQLAEAHHFDQARFQRLLR